MYVGVQNIKANKENLLEEYCNQKEEIFLGPLASFSA